jgi:hypothetical protein
MALKIGKTSPPNDPKKPEKDSKAPEKVPQKPPMKAKEPDDEPKKPAVSPKESPFPPKKASADASAAPKDADEDPSVLGKPATTVTPEDDAEDDDPLESYRKALSDGDEESGEEDRKVPQDVARYLPPGSICGRCWYYEEPGSCQVVKGTIDPGAVCVLWMPRRSSEV